jgi:hypothetical protein
VPPMRKRNQCRLVGPAVPPLAAHRPEPGRSIFQSRNEPDFSGESTWGAAQLPPANPTEINANISKKQPEQSASTHSDAPSGRRRPWNSHSTGAIAQRQPTKSRQPEPASTGYAGRSGPGWLPKTDTSPRHETCVCHCHRHSPIAMAPQNRNRG